MRLFLSHSGADTALAKEVKQAILAAAGREDLHVWLDVDELPDATGQNWREGIDAALQSSTAFAVIVGSGGVRNWVRAETDVALSRAIKDAQYRFIPILVDGAQTTALDPFSARYQAVRDPLNNPDTLRELVQALATGDTALGRMKLTDRPFPGLRSMTAGWSDRFFGRRTETDDVIALLEQEPVVAISADSGAGKSSLAMAGVGQAWLGGAMRHQRPAFDDPELWHVVTMRPRMNPLESLKQAVTAAADQVGQSADARSSLRQRVTLNDPSETLYALECDLPAGQVRTLLIVDQAEELLALPKPERDGFGDLLARMVEISGQSDRLRILITVRADYARRFETIRGIGPLARREQGTYRLKIPNSDSVSEMIRLPMVMAGFTDDAEIGTLTQRVLSDVSHRPGDLALVQMALHLAWRDKDVHGSLLAAYGAIGGVAGALGREAERVAQETLEDAERRRLVPLFIRLIRLGETTGATRRIADLDEFGPADRALIDKLSGEACGRLLMVSENTVEIAHEALIAQWGELADEINLKAQEVRWLGELMPVAAAWEADNRHKRHAPSAADLESFEDLAAREPDWLISTETAFLNWARRRVRLGQLARGLVAATLVGLFVLSGVLFMSGRASERDAEKARADAGALLERVDAVSEQSEIALTRIEDLAEETAKINRQVQELSFVSREQLQVVQETAKKSEAVLGRVNALTDDLSGLKWTFDTELLRSFDGTVFLASYERQLTLTPFAEVIACFTPLVLVSDFEDRFDNSKDPRSPRFYRNLDGKILDGLESMNTDCVRARAQSQDATRAQSFEFPVSPRLFRAINRSKEASEKANALNELVYVTVIHGDAFKNEQDDPMSFVIRRLFLRVDNEYQVSCFHDFGTPSENPTRDFDELAQFVADFNTNADANLCQCWCAPGRRRMGQFALILADTRFKGRFQI